MNTRELSPREALRRQKTGALLLDVREPYEHATGMAEGAIALPLGELMQRIAAVVPDTTSEVLVICAHGPRSLRAAAALQQRGWQVWGLGTQHAPAHASATHYLQADLLDGARIDAERLAADIDRAQSVILLGEADGETLACAHVAVEDGAGYFGMFSVSPGLQGQGIGKRMLDEAERIARDVFAQDAMRMTVIDVRDELIGYYARRGYRRTGIHKPFPYGDERFGTPKRDDLRFEILEKAL